MSGLFDKELESIVNQHSQDFSRKLAQEVSALILRKLGIDQGALSSPRSSSGAGRPGRKKGAAKAAPAPKATPAKKATRAPRKRASGEDRNAVLEKVYRAIASHEGMAVSEVIKATNLSRGAVTAALKNLKEQRRIFMGGTRRFARYANSQQLADRASEAAHNG